MKKKCKCGYTKEHNKVVHTCNYSGFGWFLFTVLGLSAKPQSVSFTCSVCNETIEINSNPELLKKYVGR